MIAPWKASQELEAFILRIAPAHCATLCPSTTYEGMCSDRAETGCFLVDSANSEQTIYSAPSVNYAMRAWHDSVHYAYQLDFSLESELAVSKRMIAQLPYIPTVCVEGRHVWAGDVVYADTAGQSIAQSHTGGFPVNQALFVALCLHRGFGDGHELRHKGDIRGLCDAYTRAGGTWA